MAEQRPGGTRPEQLVGERLGGRFVIERAIGSGHVSTAFRARDELLSRTVTLKLFHPAHTDDVAVVEQQLELASAVARMSHPNIVTVIDRGEHDGHPFVVLEHVRGENLQERIERYAPLSGGEVTHLGRSIARALTYAHAHGVAHGNLRPANVLVSEDGEIKLVDFGGGSTLSGLTGGDPYVAPELRLEDPSRLIEAGPEDDVFALGVLLHVALTEQPPRLDGDVMGLQMRRPDVPEELARIVVAASATDPAMRPASMRDIAGDLGRVKVLEGGGRGRGRGRGDAAPETGELGPGLVELAREAWNDGGDAAGSTTVLAAAGGRHDVVPPAPEVAPARSAVARRHQQPRRARLVAWGMVLVPLAALVLVIVLVAGERDKGQRAAPGGSGEQRSAKPVRVAISQVLPFDPQGDGHELDSDLPKLIDDDLSTSWQSEGYDSPAMGGVKDGVGVILELARPARLRGVVPQTDMNGWTATVYGADSPQAKLSGWKKFSKAQRVVDNEPVVVDTPAHAYRYWLVWITGLSLAQDGKFRASAQELSVRAEPAPEDSATGDEGVLTGTTATGSSSG